MGLTPAQPRTPAPLDEVSLRVAAESRGWTIGASNGNGRKHVVSPDGVAMCLHASIVRPFWPPQQCRGAVVGLHAEGAVVCVASPARRRSTASPRF